MDPIARTSEVAHDLRVRKWQIILAGAAAGLICFLFADRFAGLAMWAGTTAVFAAAAIPQRVVLTDSHLTQRPWPLSRAVALQDVAEVTASSAGLLRVRTVQGQRVTFGPLQQVGTAARLVLERRDAVVMSEVLT